MFALPEMWAKLTDGLSADSGNASGTFACGAQSTTGNASQAELVCEDEGLLASTAL